ncbi:MAG: hypothetical protein GY847_37460 [Proteobacteria bacterium]|nr:hypothetical protein [Pseudomonadota bacterium]
MIGGKKKVAIIVGLVVLAFAAAFLLYFYKTQTTWIDSHPYQRIGSQPARALVVVYSRTGNTMGAAKEVARFFDADLLKIEAPQYERTLKGQMLAARDADNEVTTTPIRHDPVDLSNYELIIICSPTWWFRPAPPLWSFVENHDFVGRSVLLLMTGNSRLKEELTGKFGTLVKEKNGKFLEALFIQRGRIYWQRTPDEVNKDVREALEARRSMWSVTKALDMRDN